MELDNLDLSIIRILQNNSCLTSYHITKKIFDHDYSKLRSKSNTIRYRLDKLLKDSMILERKSNGKKFYSLNTDIVRLRKKANIYSGNISIEVYDVIFIKLGKGKWDFYQTNRLNE